VLAEMAERDHRDSSRAVAPLAAAAEATVIDTEGLTVDEVVARIAGLARAVEVGGETD